MKLPPTFMEGIIITLLWILCNSGGSTQTTETTCNRPEHIVTKQAHLYQSIDVANVTVYQCRYHEENLCDIDICEKCKIGVENYTVEKKYVNQYDDITSNCLKAFKNHYYTSKYGFTYNTFEINKNKYDCDGNKSHIIRTITIYLTKEEVKLDVNQDRLTLKSGAVCRYSSGFCHDGIKGIDVMWNVSDPKHFSCTNLQKIDVSDVYNFALGPRKYSLIQTDHRYFLVELTSSSTLCNVTMWKTEKNWLLVAEKPVMEANNSKNNAIPLDLGIPFKHKQDVYDFVIDSCVLAEDKKDLQTRTLLESELKMKLRQESLMEDLETQLQYFRHHLEIVFYVTVSVVLCSVVVLVSTVCFVYWKVKKNTDSGEFNLPKPNNGNVYEYISSDYNINSLYNKKC